MVAKLPARFTNEDAARKHLEAIQWPDGPVCPHCGVLDRASAISGGRQTFDLGDALDGVKAGNYTYGIDAQDGDGNSVGVTTYMSGKVDGISSGTDGLVLNLGTLQIPYANVVAVTD